MYKELPNTDLSNLNIDFARFQTELVTFYLKYSPKGYGLSLKHKPGQESDRLDNTHLTVNTDWEDNLISLRYLVRTIPVADPTAKESNYTEYNQEIIEEFPYIVDCITKIENYTNLKFGRIRIAPLRMQVSLPRHHDFGNIRYHIPIVSSDNAMFIVGDEVFAMSNYDKLYHLPCGNIHTAINCSPKIRLHLLLVDSAEENRITPTNHLIDSINKAVATLENASDADRMLNKDYYLELAEMVKRARQL